MWRSRGCLGPHAIAMRGLPREHRGWREAPRMRRSRRIGIFGRAPSPAYTGLVARHEPSGRQSAGEPPPAKVKMRLHTKGRWMPVEEPRVTTETTEAAERPPTPDDPRPAAFRQI